MTRIRPATGGHSQLTLKRERDVLDGIAFGRPDLAETVQIGDRVDVVGRLSSHRFGGFESLQLEIRDIATSGSHLEAAAILSAAATAANQNTWIKFMKVALKLPKYKNMKLVKIYYGNDNPAQSRQATVSMLQAYPNLKGIESPTTVGISSAAQFLDHRHHSLAR